MKRWPPSLPLPAELDSPLGAIVDGIWREGLEVAALMHIITHASSHATLNLTEDDGTDAAITILHALNMAKVVGYVRIVLHVGYLAVDTIQIMDPSNPESVLFTTRPHGKQKRVEIVGMERAREHLDSVCEPEKWAGIRSIVQVEFLRLFLRRFKRHPVIDGNLSTAMGPYVRAMETSVTLASYEEFASVPQMITWMRNGSVCVTMEHGRRVNIRHTSSEIRIDIVGGQQTTRTIYDVPAVKDEEGTCCSTAAVYRDYWRCLPALRTLCYRMFEAYGFEVGQTSIYNHAENTLGKVITAALSDKLELNVIDGSYVLSPKGGVYPWHIRVNMPSGTVLRFMCDIESHLIQTFIPPKK